MNAPDATITADTHESGLMHYTVFVQQADGRGTTHVSSHEAADVATAKQLALQETAEDWGDDIANLRVMGVAAGDVELLEWDDLDG